MRQARRSMSVVALLLFAGGIVLVEDWLVRDGSTASCYTSTPIDCVTNHECVEESDGRIQVTCAGSVCETAESGSACCTNSEVTVANCSRRIIDWHCIMYPLCVGGAEWCTYTDINPGTGSCWEASLGGSCP